MREKETPPETRGGANIQKRFIFNTVPLLIVMGSNDFIENIRTDIYYNIGELKLLKSKLRG